MQGGWVSEITPQDKVLRDQFGQPSCLDSQQAYPKRESVVLSRAKCPQLKIQLRFARATESSFKVVWNRASKMVVGQNQWYHFGVGASPILIYFSEDCDVHRGYDLDFDPWPNMSFGASRLREELQDDADVVRAAIRPNDAISLARRSIL